MTPAIWSLNFRGLQWLEDELVTWNKKLALASGAAKPEIKAYIDAVTAERDQRKAQYTTIGGTIWGGISAPFETLGGSSGKGAAGLSAGIADTVGGAASSAMGIVNKVLVVVALAGGIYLYTKLKKK